MYEHGVSPGIHQAFTHSLPGIYQHGVERNCQEATIGYQ